MNMTRAEWVIEWRRRRVEKEGIEITLSNYSAALSEVYDYIYTPKEQAYMRLVNRYRPKLRQEHFDKVESFKSPARQRAKELLKTIVYSESPFLKMTAKDEPSFYGTFIPVKLTW